MILNLGGCHVESKNSGERASGVRNHTRLCLGLFVRRHSSLKEFAGIGEIRLPNLRDEIANCEWSKMGVACMARYVDLVAR